MFSWRRVIRVFVIVFVLLQISCIRVFDDKNDETTNTYAWTIVESGTTQILYDVDFTDSQNGWVVGDSSTILHSFDGGESWQR